jgi:Zn-dependent protease
MSIVALELKKILEPRVLLFLAAFTFFYYLLFMQITLYPAGGQSTNSEYDIAFAGELVEEFGTTLSLSEWSKLDDKATQLENALSGMIRQDEILQTVGVDNYEDMIALGDKLWDKDEAELTVEEQRVSDEISQIIFFRSESSKLVFELAYLNSLDTENKGQEFGMSQEDADIYLDEIKASDMYKAAMRERLTKNYVSLLPDGMFYILQKDMVHMEMLLVICFMVLILRYQIRENLSCVLPIFASSYTGRTIYRKQFWAGIISCGIVGVIQLFIYLGIYIRKGLVVFWQCECWSAGQNYYWCDGLSFGAYMGIYMILILFATMGVVVVAYLIGRAVMNYVAGIAVAIPVGGFTGYVIGRVFSSLFCMKATDRMAFYELLVLLVWIVFVGTIVLVRLKVDKKIDI